MKSYNFAKPIIDFTTGRPFPRQQAVDLTVLEVIIAALMAQEGNGLHSPAEREARLNLAEKLQYKAKEFDIKLSEEEVALIRKACGQATATQFYGWVIRSLEPPTKQ